MPAQFAPTIEIKKTFWSFLISIIGTWMKTKGSLGVEAEQKSKTCFRFFEATLTKLFSRQAKQSPSTPTIK